MKNKSIINLSIKTTSLVFVLLASTGCSALTDNYTQENNIKINKLNSDMATIAQVNVEQTESGIYIRGQLRRKLNQRGSIPGHIDIEIKNPAGKSLYKQKVSYMRKNTQSAYSRFYQAIDLKPEPGSTILVKHRPTYNIVEHGND